LATGKDFEEIGKWTPVQLGVVMKAITERRKELAAMWGGSEAKSDDMTTAMEQKFHAMKQKTGRDKFDIRELI
jgi:hypothetical protein